MPKVTKLVRRGFRAKDAPAPSIARNLDKRRGKPVVASDIAVYALPLHPPCNGRGYVKERRAAFNGTDQGEANAFSSVEVAVPCKCATKRFLRAHPEIIMDASGGAWWPAPPELRETHE